MSATPSQINNRAVADLLSEGCLNIRAALSGTSSIGQLQAEGRRLVEMTGQMQHHQEYMYIRKVDDLFTMHRATWGDQLTNTLCKQGVLSALPSVVISNLPDAIRDQALDFWNGVARRYRCNGPTRDALPQAMREAIDGYLDYSDDGVASSTVADLARFDQTLSGDAAARVYEKLVHIEKSDHHNPLVRFVHVADDLHWVAPLGLLLSHWRQWMCSMLGGHTLTSQDADSSMVLEPSTDA